MPGRQITADEFEWLIAKRRSIQTFNLDLLQFIEVNSNEMKSGRVGVLFDLTQLLVASNFSLWRSIFLTYQSRSQESITDSLCLFLRNILYDNTVTFARDVDTQSWMGQYYGINSRFRLARFLDKVRIDLKDESVNHVDGIVAFERDLSNYYGFSTGRETTLHSASLRQAIDIQFVFQCSLFQWLLTYAAAIGLKLP